MFEHSLKPPLLFVGNGIPRGKTIDTPVYMQDLMPTTLEMAGIEIPESVDFRSLLPVLEGRDDEQDRVMYGAYKNKQRMVLKQGKKLIWYPTSNTYLLFDIIEDPLEMNDLYANPAYAAVAMELMQELKNQQALLNDPMLTGAAVTEDGVVH
jgi:arylsulfatase A-like enzyme